MVLVLIVLPIIKIFNFILKSNDGVLNRVLIPLVSLDSGAGREARLLLLVYEQLEVAQALL